MTVMDESEYLGRLYSMSNTEREEILDPICAALRGTAQMPNGGEILANRLFALKVIDLYQQWQDEVYNRE